MSTVNDDCQHSVTPSADYPYATERYPRSDPRYALCQAYSSLVEAQLGYQVFNCKISPLQEWGYNVYLYLLDARRDLGDQWLRITLLSDRNHPMTALFEQALAVHPVEWLDGRKINPNGVLVQDFKTCSVSYALERAAPRIRELVSRYPAVTFDIQWNTSFYLFFSTTSEMGRFHHNDAPRFLEQMWAALKEFDNHGFFTEVNPVQVILDLQDHYDTIGGRNYFNSDAMAGAIRLGPGE